MVLALAQFYQTPVVRVGNLSSEFIRSGHLDKLVRHHSGKI